MSESSLVRSTAHRETRRQIKFRGRGFVTIPKPLWSWMTIPVLIVIWQAACSAGVVDQVFLPSPLSVLQSLNRLFWSGDLWRNLSASLYRIALGWISGTLVGLVVGLGMGLISSLRAAGMPIISALFPVPKIALLPLLILWLGIGEAPKVVTIALGVFFPTAIAAFSGVDNVPRSLIRMGQSFDFPLSHIIRKIILPAALPNIFAGFRISISTALLLVVSAEMIGAQFGIGALLLSAGNLMQTDDLIAGVVLLSVLGLLFGGGLSLLERSLLRWR